MKKDSKYPWYILDIVLFLAINILLWRKIGSSIDTTDLLTPLKLFVFGLATYRLADIIATEGVTEVLRAPFMERRDSTWTYATEGFRGFFGSLISCPACVGVWVAALLFYLYLFFPTAGSIFMILLCLSGFERFFSKIYNFFENMEKK